MRETKRFRQRRKGEKGFEDETLPTKEAVEYITWHYNI
jgi:hypothetical protein